MKPKNAGRLQIRPATQRLALTAVLGALALVLSALEMMIPPLPVLPPGAKLGLSNIATMYASGSVGLLPALAISVIKGLFAGVTRGVTAMLMSLAGGVVSTLLMALMLHAKSSPFGIMGVGIGGALAHNAGQLAVALLLTTPAVVYYVPWLLVFSVLTGILTGFVLKAILPVLQKLPYPTDGKSGEDG